MQLRSRMRIDLYFYVSLGTWGSYFAGLQCIEVCQKDVVARSNGCDVGDDRVALSFDLFPYPPILHRKAQVFPSHSYCFPGNRNMCRVVTRVYLRNGQVQTCRLLWWPPVGESVPGRLLVIDRRGQITCAEHYRRVGYPSGYAPLHLPRSSRTAGEED